MERHEVIVLGLGELRSSALASFALRGRKLLGLEQFHRAHAKDSSRGESGIIRLASFEDSGYMSGL